MMLNRYEDHPKYQSSALRTQATCRAICEMFAGEGLNFVPDARRDGFTFEGPRGQLLLIDPKVEALRVKIGHNPEIPPPMEFVHKGRQPDWIVIEPNLTQLALDYLLALIRERRR